MKSLRYIILIVFVLSFMPLGAFCDDHHDAAEHHHHGIIMCHAACHGAVLTSQLFIQLPATKTYFISSDRFIYEAPYLPTAFRPPIILSS